MPRLSVDSFGTMPEPSYTRSPICIAWFGIPGTRYYTKVHICLRGQPVCGVKMTRDMELQWCSYSNLEYVECDRCKHGRFADAMRAAQTEFKRILDERAKLKTGQ